jgi:hypothetical protein
MEATRVLAFAVAEQPARPRRRRRYARVSQTGRQSVMCTNRCSGVAVSEEMHEFETEGVHATSDSIHCLTAASILVFAAC